MPAYGISDPRQTIGLNEITQQKPAFDPNQSYNYNGFDFQFDTPERRAANALQAANGVNGSSGADPYAMPSLDASIFQKLGYNGPVDAGSYGEAGGGYKTAPELQDWMAANGYQYGLGGRGQERLSGIFDRNGNPVSDLHAGTEKGEFAKAMAPIGMFVGAGLAGLGTGGATTLGSELGASSAYQAGLAGQGAIDTAASAGSLGSDFMGGLAPGENPSFLSTTAASEAAPGAANGMWDVLPSATSGGMEAGTMGGASGLGGQIAEAAGGGGWMDKIGSLFGGKSGNVIGGLLDIYGQNKSKQGFQNVLDRSSTLNNSYEKALRQNLMRRDAQVGRRSNYSGREVELQAKLAQLNAQQMDSQMKAQGGITDARNNTLKDLYGIGSNIPWKEAGSWLGGLFGG